MEYTIRKATLDDASTLNNFLTLLIRDEKKYDSNINELCVVKNFYENIILNDSNIILVAVANNKVVGYLFGYIANMGDSYIDKISNIDALYIEENYRHNGIATSLINEFKLWSINNDAKYMEVKVLNSNTDAFKLYNKEGFEEFKSILHSKIQ